MESPQNIELVQLGAAIRKTRESKDWSLAQLAETSGIQADLIGKFEAGAVEASILDLAAISKALGLNLAALLKLAGL